jgi:hypothetical protein
VLDTGYGVTWNEFDLDGVVEEGDVLQFVYKAFRAFMMGKIKKLLLPWDLDGESVRDGKARKLIRPGEQIFSGRKTFETLPEIEGARTATTRLFQRPTLIRYLGVSRPLIPIRWN